MSFADMKKDELLEVAEIFGTDVEAGFGEEAIRTSLLSDGVTWEMYTDAKRTADPTLLEINLPDPEPVAIINEEPTTQKFKSRNSRELLKMERWNPTYEVIGYKFAHNHPFVLVTPEDANWIMANEEGFRLATPEEAEAFYK